MCVFSLSMAYPDDNNMEYVHTVDLAMSSSVWWYTTITAYLTACAVMSTLALKQTPVSSARIAQYVHTALSYRRNHISPRSVCIILSMYILTSIMVMVMTLRDYNLNEGCGRVPLIKHEAQL